MISDINRLISIDYDRLQSISIEYRKYRLGTPWYLQQLFENVNNIRIHTGNAVDFAPCQEK